MCVCVCKSAKLMKTNEISYYRPNSVSRIPLIPFVGSAAPIGVYYRRYSTQNFHGTVV